jgi:hypothetical protein
LWLKHYFHDNPLDDNYNRRLYHKSSWTPPDWKIHQELQRRFKEFGIKYNNLFQRRHGVSNLLPSQRLALQYLQKSTSLMVVQCDKNLGPSLIEKESYIRMAFKDHLHDQNTYQYLTPEEASTFGETIRKQLTNWLKRWNTIIPSNEKKTSNS